MGEPSAAYGREGVLGQGLSLTFTFSSLFRYVAYLHPVKKSALTFAAKTVNAEESSSFLLDYNFASLVAFAFSILKFYFNKILIFRFAKHRFMTNT